MAATQTVSPRAEPPPSFGIELDFETRPTPRPSLPASEPRGGSIKDSIIRWLEQQV